MAKRAQKHREKISVHTQKMKVKVKRKISKGSLGGAGDPNNNRFRCHDSSKYRVSNNNHLVAPPGGPNYGEFLFGSPGVLLSGLR